MRTNTYKTARQCNQKHWSEDQWYLTHRTQGSSLWGQGVHDNDKAVAFGCAVRL